MLTTNLDLENQPGPWNSSNGPGPSILLTFLRLRPQKLRFGVVHSNAKTKRVLQLDFYPKTNNSYKRSWNNQSTSANARILVTVTASPSGGTLVWNTQPGEWDRWIAIATRIGSTQKKRCWERWNERKSITLLGVSMLERIGQAEEYRDSINGWVLENWHALSWKRY